MTVPPGYEPPPAYGPPPDSGMRPPAGADGAYPPQTHPYPDQPSYPSAPYPYVQPYPAPPTYPGPPTNALAIASLASAFLCSPLAIVFGHVSLAQIRRSGEQGRGLAIAGLVIGYLLTAATVVVLVFGLMLARLSWDAMQSGVPGYRAAPSTADRTLPDFFPPAGLGSSCSYPATATAAVRPVKPPRSGKVPTEPAVISATLTTGDGAIGLQLENGQAPCTVNSFVSLARQGFFDKTPCHRLTTEASLGVLQCGDPAGNGSGGPGYRFDNEYPTNQYRRLDPALSRPVVYPRGTLAMANSGPNSNGSQFFIVYRDSLMPPTYTVFGRVDEADMAVVDRWAAAGVKGGGNDGSPAKPITITSVVVK